jgi:phosphatidylglycerophosphatase A
MRANSWYSQRMSIAIAPPAWQLRLARTVAIGFGSGASPKAPGTAGSLAGLILGAALMRASPLLLLAGVLAATYGGLWSIRTVLPAPDRADPQAGHDDPGWIVIDEIAGQMLALLALQRLSIAGLAAAFALFRLFDITKPGPIGWADRQSGPAAIMADDLLAGAATALILVLIHLLLPKLL